jgi:thiol-disulfide isomerase/thioredoxin
MSMTAQILLRGKDCLFAKCKTDNQEVEIYSNGKTHYLHMVNEKKYQKLDVAVPRARLMGAMGGGLFGGPIAWLADFFNNSEQLLSQAKNAANTASQAIDDKVYGVFTLDYGGLSVTADIEQGQTPILRRAVMDLSRGLSDSPHGKMNMTAKVTADIIKWTPNAEAKDDAFTFTPPEGVSLQEAKDDKQETVSLEGKAAPDFTIPLLDGGDLKLSMFKGKNVVILDFWATWCGPCRMAMPALEKVAGEFADKGVLLFAVNQQEEPEKIKAFLEKQNLKVKVALDKDMKAAQLYSVQGIPRIIVIDKEGVIRKDLAGYLETLEDDMRNVITPLVK